mmetsp:Transcript_36626/g.123994  ORF Transcript_36626/g.123994 Transcript_36626/m.123994 type:complete len:155 (-) Transcript_36626:342-806(-)
MIEEMGNLSVVLQIADDEDTAQLGDNCGYHQSACCQKANGAIMCYDQSNDEALRRVSRRKAEFDSDVTFRSGDVLPVVLVATKCDGTSAIDKNALDLFCVNNGFVAWFQTSAKTGEGVDAAFNCLTSNIMMCQDRWRHDERSYEDIFVENCACG